MKKNNQSIGELCSELSWANLQIYEAENKKWWGRKKSTATSEDIDNLDKSSREWNEKRSYLKRNIDELIKKNINKIAPKAKQNFSISEIFPVMPISLMIDMLTIENIKIYDLEKKEDSKSSQKAQLKRNQLIKTINIAFKNVIEKSEYKTTLEARTF